MISVELIKRRPERDYKPRIIFFYKEQRTETNRETERGTKTAKPVDREGLSSSLALHRLIGGDRSRTCVGKR